MLVNNAGTAEPRVGAADLTAEEAMQGFGINVFGPIRVTHAFLPLLRASDNPRIVNVSSGAGSFGRIATLPKDGPTGTFQDRYGTVPW